MSAESDDEAVLVEGPWTHRFVVANGARFHVAEQGPARPGHHPLVLFLHGFPQFWWMWRHQLTALAEGGYRAVAMDLRGFGASDKPPLGHDTWTACADVTAVIRSLGEGEAVVVGHGLGGWIAWTLATLRTEVTRAIGVVAMPHPTVFRAMAVTSPRQIRANHYLMGMQRPFGPERVMAGKPGYVRDRLRHGAARGSGWPSIEEEQRYAAALALPFVADCATDHFRWLVRSQFRPTGWHLAARMRRKVPIPVLAIHGAQDRVVVPGSLHRSAGHVTGPFTAEVIDGAGHFPAEEQPDAVNDALLRWLAST